MMLRLMKFLARIAREHGVGDHTYIVGGAVRNHILGEPIKDIDVVVDSVSLGESRDSAWFAQIVAERLGGDTNLTTNQYGVAIVTAKNPTFKGIPDGEVIEIANARKESYGGADGKGYKPHMVEPATIMEDVVRREFTFNTLLWRLGDLVDGPQHAEVIDLTERGRLDLSEGVMRTPACPDKTFGDDPTRMLRAVKFALRYNFVLDAEAKASIQRNAEKLANVPHNAVSVLLCQTIFHDPSKVHRALLLLEELRLLPVIRVMLTLIPEFAATMESWVLTRVTTFLMLRATGQLPLSGGLGFLSESDLLRLREIASFLEEETALEFAACLRQPGKAVDMKALIEATGFKGAEINRINMEARQTLLLAPELRRDREALTSRIRSRLGC